MPGRRDEITLRKAKLVVVLDKGPDFDAALREFNEEKDKRREEEEKAKAAGKEGDEAKA